jgi:hypothetical protein
VHLLQVDLVRPKTNLLYKTDELIDIVEHAKERLAAKKAVKKRLKAQKRRAKRTAAATAGAAAGAVDSTTTAAAGRSRHDERTVNESSSANGAADDDEPVYITVMNYETGQTERIPIDMSEYVSDAEDSDYSDSSSDSSSDSDNDSSDSDSDTDAATDAAAVDDVADDAHGMELHKKPWHRGVRAPEQVGPDVRRQFKASSSAVRGEDVTVFMVSCACKNTLTHSTTYACCVSSVVVLVIAVQCSCVCNLRLCC